VALEVARSDVLVKPVACPFATGAGFVAAFCVILLWRDRDVLAIPV